MNAFEQRFQNDLLGLGWISRFGWLRTAELGPLIWPNDTYARTRTDRLARAVVYDNQAMVQADAVSQVLQRLNNIGWQENEIGCLVSHYGKQIATVWEDATMGWSYSIKDDHALCAHTKAQAMRGCAELISEVRVELMTGG